MSASQAGKMQSEQAIPIPRTFAEQRLAASTPQANPTAA
jgi:hypothetical protein